MVNIKDFHSNLLNIEKKSHKDINIYYIGYIAIKKFSDCENIHSVKELKEYQKKYREAKKV